MISLFSRLSLCLVFFLAQTALSQEYSLAISAQEYSDLPNPVLIAEGAGIADGYMCDVDFSFSAFGHRYGFDKASTSQGIYGQGLYVTRQGYVAAYEVPDNSSSIGIFHAFLAELEGKAANASQPASSISYQITGSAGSRILKFQWKNMGLAGNPASDYVNVQLWFYEEDTSVSVHVGALAVSGNAAFNNASGPCIGISRTSCGFDRIMGAAYIGGSVSNPAMVSLGGWTPVNGIPQNGTVFTIKARVQTPSDVAELAGAEILRVVPQPATGNFILSMELDGALKLGVTLCDLRGDEIPVAAEEAVSGHREYLIQRGDLPAGIYFLRIVLDGRAFMRKIVF